MINIQIEGDKALIAKFSGMNQKTKMALTRAVTASALKLEAYIKSEKLMGQVLNHRTGNLWRSIHTPPIQSTDNYITATVASSGDVKYAGIHEYGGTIRTRLGTGKGKPNPKHSKAVIEMPERSFMRSSLSDMRQEIVDRLSMAVKEGTS